MTNVNHTLDPIRPDNGTVGDNMPSVDVEVVQVQEEILKYYKIFYKLYYIKCTPWINVKTCHPSTNASA